MFFCYSSTVHCNTPDDDLMRWSKVKRFLNWWIYLSNKSDCRHACFRNKIADIVSTVLYAQITPNSEFLPEMTCFLTPQTHSRDKQPLLLLLSTPYRLIDVAMSVLTITFILRGHHPWVIFRRRTILCVVS